MPKIMESFENTIITMEEFEIIELEIEDTQKQIYTARKVPLDQRFPNFSSRRPL